jgi:hypothetical protein
MGVFGSGQDIQVLGFVVEPVAVDVVNDFLARE